MSDDFLVTKLEMATGSGVAILKVSGPEVRRADLQGLRDSLMELADQGYTNLVVDMVDVRFVESPFLGMLMLLQKNLTARGGRVLLCMQNRNLRQSLHVMRVDRLFGVFRDREEALAELGGESELD